MAYRKTQSFRRSDQPAPASALSFWRRLFGGKAVRKEQLVREQPRSKTERITGTLTISGPLADRGTSRPKSFISKKFDSQPVKAALLNAIGQAMDSPPAELEPNQHQNWLDGLARKGLLVERLDCSKLKPDEHLRAIQWLAKIEALSPLKLTYREDLFGLRYRLATLQDRTKDVSGQLPEAVAHGGIALRRLCQSLRQKSEKLAEMSSKAATNATLEIALYDCLLEAIERIPIALLDSESSGRLASLFRRVDPDRQELTARHPQFRKNVEKVLLELRFFEEVALASEQGASS